VVAVETQREEPGFSTMQEIEHLVESRSPRFSEIALMKMW
jgi:hypothetical protein